MNIWLAQVSLGNRKSCPACRRKLEGDNCIISVGEYFRGIYRYAFYCCENCFRIAWKRHMPFPLHSPTQLCYRPGQQAIPWVEREKDKIIAEYKERCGV